MAFDLSHLVTNFVESTCLESLVRYTCCVYKMYFTNIVVVAVVVLVVSGD